MTKKDIGQILKNLRLNTGKTQAEIAKKLGRTQQIIGHWETGYAQPDANTLFELCDIYGVSVDEAFNFDKKNQFTQHEIEIIKAYREKKELQAAVDILLQVSSRIPKVEVSDEISEITKTSYLLEDNGLSKIAQVNEESQLPPQKPPA